VWLRPSRQGTDIIAEMIVVKGSPHAVAYCSSADTIRS
jgi:hypothetical protein